MIYFQFKKGACPYLPSLSLQLGHVQATLRKRLAGRTSTLTCCWLCGLSAGLKGPIGVAACDVVWTTCHFVGSVGSC